MQPFTLKLPDLGEGVVEAEIVAWHVQPGEDVRVDQPLVDVMTDKATVTIPSGQVGRVVRTHGSIGETVAVGAELVSFDTSPPQSIAAADAAAISVGESTHAPTNGTPHSTKLNQQLEEPISVPLIQRGSRAVEVTRAAPAQASPAVRRRARELHVDLHDVQGTGPNGRITHGDMDVHLRSEFAQ